MAYNIKIGVVKSVKNVFIVMGIPAIILLLDNYTQWVPAEYNKIALPVIGLIAYFIKNYIQNK